MTSWHANARLSLPAPLLVAPGVFGALLALHRTRLDLPYFWDEAGYFIPAALDFYRSGLLIPQNTLPTGHTPLVMVYLALAWRVFGSSPIVTRAAMILVAAATVAALFALARLVVEREPAAWSALLLALSPLFFAQSPLAHLDLAAGLFTMLAVLALLRRRLLMFALAASLAVSCKETAVVLLPVAWLFVWRSVGVSHQRHAGIAAVPFGRAWPALTVPLLPLLAWTVYYHHATGYWTGNPEYLHYNLYSTLVPLRILLSLLRRVYEVFIGGFNWLLVVGAAFGIWWERKNRADSPDARTETGPRPFADIVFIAIGLCVAYLLMLSVVGGAVLPRYLLPIFPLFVLVGVMFVWRLPKLLARIICLAVVGCFVGAWFINPPYPFPFEDNLSYADFIRLHQQAAQFLEARPDGQRILTAWPASDELRRPFLGYVRRPLTIVSIQGFTPDDFSRVGTESFDTLYLYSRKWEPGNNWLMRFPKVREIQARYFGYAPQIREETLVARYRLKLLSHIERRGQWVRIYSK